MKPALALMLLGLFACDAEPAAAVREPGAAPAPTVAPFDLDGYCSAMCKRATACGSQAAEGPASRSGGAGEALKEAKAGAEELERSCLAGCKWRPVDAADRSAALQAERCLDEKDCAALEKCLGEI